MNIYAKIAEGLAAWLSFEHRCGRANLFSEASLAHPLGQLLQYRYPGRVLAEVEHPILTAAHIGVGAKPRIDFAVSGPAGIYDLVVETKWVSQSPTLLRDILRDFIRLDLVLGSGAQDALLILAGEKRNVSRLFSHTQFRAHPEHPSSKDLLPVGEGLKRSIRFNSVPAFRRPLFRRTLEAYCNISVPKRIQIQCSGPFPRAATAKHYEIYVWRVINHVTGVDATFNPAAEYEELSAPTDVLVD
jgi:hypothetical protein